eukprot:1985476-Heterocapsa_arctica.AAC.1
MEGGIPQGIEERWEEHAVYTGPSRGPVNYYRRTIRHLGWLDVGFGSIVDEKRKLRQIDEWPSFVRDGKKRARQQTWQKAAKKRPHYKGGEGGVDENTAIKYYVKLAQKKPLDAGALHTILADGVWTPERAEKRRNNVDGACKIKQRRAKECNKPACFWLAGIVLSGWTTSPDTEN